MEQIRINRCSLSQLIWSNILAATSHVNRELLANPLDHMNHKRSEADYNTGSINFTNAWCLYSLARYVAPSSVAEVGTFIGRSTMAIAEGMQDGLSKDPIIYTCDGSNDINILDRINVGLVQYPKTLSTDMFKTLVRDGKKIDMFFIDGRLSEIDFAYIDQLKHESTIFALDDFEGVEKGVINALNFTHLLNSGYTLVYPPDTKLLREHGLAEPCNLAFVSPFKSFIFVPQ